MNARGGFSGASEALLPPRVVPSNNAAVRQALQATVLGDPAKIDKALFGSK